jgi:hypothetical protein
MEGDDEPIVVGSRFAALFEIGASWREANRRATRAALPGTVEGCPNYSGEPQRIKG